MKQIVDYNSWKRREVFNFFRKFIDPQFSVTADVECTRGYRRAKERGESFFIHYLYAILKAHNRVEEFHYRVESKGDGVKLANHPEGEIEIYRYDKINITTVVKINDEGDYRSIFIPYSEDFDQFYAIAKERVEAAKSQSEPFPADDSNGLGIVCVSAVPCIRFTSMTGTLQSVGAVDMIPLMNVGQMAERDGVRTMPIMVQMNHGLIDAHHINMLFRYIEEELK